MEDTAYRPKIRILRGARAIADHLSLTERQVHNMLEKGQLKGAVKKGKCWHITQENAERNFEPVEA
jgi:hypothetical protein